MVGGQLDLRLIGHLHLLLAAPAFVKRYWDATRRDAPAMHALAPGGFASYAGKARATGLPDRMLGARIALEALGPGSQPGVPRAAPPTTQGDLCMRIVVAAAIILSLTGSAYCQSPTFSGGRPALGFPLGDKPNAPSDPQSEEHDKAYKSAIEKLPTRQKSDDPWQGVRSNSTTQTQKSGR